MINRYTKNRIEFFIEFSKKLITLLITIIFIYNCPGRTNSRCDNITIFSILASKDEIDLKDPAQVDSLIIALLMNLDCKKNVHLTQKR